MGIRRSLSITGCICVVLSLAACGGGSSNKGPDTTPPSVPANLVSVPVSSTQISLSWSASYDDRGVAGYNVFRLVTAPAVTMETVVGTASNGFADSGLGESTHHCYQVSAYDGSGNVSGRSAVACTTTMMEFYTLPSTGESVTSLSSLPSVTMQAADTTRPPAYGTITGATTTVSSYPTYIIVNTAVTDSWTTLSWQQESDDLARTWDEAQAYCNDLDLAGYTDWRLPSRKELLSIVHYGRAGYYPVDGPAFDPIFMMAPGTIYPYNYWSASSWPASLVGGSSAWIVRFDTGESNFQSKSMRYYVRCVRGGQLPAQRFIQTDQNTVGDASTGLYWQRHYLVTGASWTNAVAACSASTVDNQSWRLPTIRELLTLVDDTRTSPTMDGTLFTDSRADLNQPYWSSTTQYSTTAGTLNAWAVFFFDGRAAAFSKDNAGASNHVRCVR